MIRTLCHNDRGTAGPQGDSDDSQAVWDLAENSWRMGECDGTWRWNLHFLVWLCKWIIDFVENADILKVVIVCWESVWQRMWNPKPGVKNCPILGSKNTSLSVAGDSRCWILRTQDFLQIYDVLSQTGFLTSISKVSLKMAWMSI